MNKLSSFFINLKLKYSLIFIAISVLVLFVYPNIITLIVCVIVASIGLIGVARLVLATPPTPPKTMDNPWTGKSEDMKVDESASKIDSSGFTAFASDNLGSSVKKMRGFKLPSLRTGVQLMLRKIMRFISAALIFVYSIVFFFSLGNIISVMFLATDFVLLYMLWLSRGG